MIEARTRPEATTLWQPPNSFEGSGSDNLDVRSIPELLSVQFQLNGNVPAVEFEDRSYSRSEIAERSDRLAFWLLSQSTAADLLVGIYMERSVEMLVAVLGVLKAGAAYVPLDPAFPKNRIEQIVSETQLPVLLTLERHLHDLPGNRARLLALDRDEALLAQEPVRVLPNIAPETRAYVIFTSGSTGRPKGVEITHRAVVNLLTDLERRLGMSAADRLLAVTTLAFDISVLELLLPLVCGGTVVIASRQETVDGALLMRRIADARVTALQATPFTWRLMLGSGFVPPAGFKMMCGGEAWHAELAHDLLASGGRLWNMYGPTETTVWSSVTEVSKDTHQITIGAPLANTRFYVLDEGMKPVQSGEEGELYIAGAGLARGYFKQPDLTQERFVVGIEFHEERLYRTGDRFRELASGQFEFLGRVDHQVKFRGYRVELGEIEAATRELPGVTDAIAVLRKDGHGEDVLATYIIGADGLDTKQLRTQLASRLPGYMVPGSLRQLSTFPFTPNGKTDRKALAELPWSAASDHTVSAGDENSWTASADVNSLEQQMLGIWKEIFDEDNIVPDSDFFALGGDSLRVLQLQAAMEEHFQVSVTLADVYRHATLAALCTWVEQTKGATSQARHNAELNSRLVPLQTSGTGKPVFLMPQNLLYETLSLELGAEQPVFALELLEEDITPSLEAASFERLTQLYVDVIREIQPHGPYRLGGWCMWGWVAYEIARILESQGEQVEYVLVMDAWAPGYWSRQNAVRKLWLLLAHRLYRIYWLTNRLLRSDMQKRKADIVRRLQNAYLSFSYLVLRREQRKSRVQRALSTAAVAYQGGPLRAKVMLFKGDHRPTGPFIEKDLGWAVAAGHSVYVSTLPGNHSEIFEPDAAKTIASQVREFLQPSPN